MIQALAYNVKNTLANNLSYFLSQPYIIKELLEDIDEKTVKEFIERFSKSSASKGVKEIPVYFGYPQDVKSMDAMVSVTSGNGQETSQSIGHVDGSFEGQGHIYTETLEVTAFEIREGVEYAVGNVVHEILYIDGITEISTDHIIHEGNKVLIRVSNVLAMATVNVGDMYTITYTAKVSGKSGLAIGFTAREEVVISIVSMNESTMACLDILIKACIITMRESLRERVMTDLPKISYTPIQPIDPELVPGTPNIVFTRDYSLVYTVSHNIPKVNTKVLTKINTKKVEGE